ncbi:unnamed protein product [Clavelina lepadiformis]|uniref:Dehydrogenase with different specificities related to short-chain alcohol dehydrogenase n=1 Tax=Clavelina lepadiformis TaxID=159417 RepID=A0ABP0G0A1_CLALP
MLLQLRQRISSYSHQKSWSIKISEQSSKSSLIKTFGLTAASGDICKHSVLVHLKKQAYACENSCRKIKNKFNLQSAKVYILFLFCCKVLVNSVQPPSTFQPESKTDKRIAMTTKRTLCCITVAVLGYLWIKFVKQSPVYEITKSLDGKTVLITGGNTGIGKATAIELARAGARVVIASRNLPRSEEARREIIELTGNDEVRCMYVDLEDLDSVRDFAKEFDETEQYLDYLINNAGVMSVFGKAKSGINRIFAINHLGHFLLTNLLLDKMKKQSTVRPVRIINLTAHSYKVGNVTKETMYNDVTSLGEMFQTASDSKLANVMFNVALDEELKKFDVTTYAVHPGMIDSGQAMGLPLYIRALIRLPVLLFTRTPYYGCQTTLYCALDDDVTKNSGGYFSDCQHEELEPLARDQDAIRFLWNESLKLSGLVTS